MTGSVNKPDANKPDANKPDAAGTNPATAEASHAPSSRWSDKRDCGTTDMQAINKHEQENLALLRRAMLLQSECRQLMEERQKLQVENRRWQERYKREVNHLERMRAERALLSSDYQQLLDVNAAQALMLQESLGKRSKVFSISIERWIKRLCRAAAPE